MILRVNLISQKKVGAEQAFRLERRMMCFIGSFSTPLGSALAVVDEGGFLRELGLFAPEEAEARVQVRVKGGMQRNEVALAAVVEQLTEYFEGKRRDFSLLLAPEGSPFQRRVWEQLQKIPYGTTTSYGVIAERLGQPGAARAVGLANGRNPLSIVVPCHRVIASNGTLAGYSGGLALKQKLLALEQQGTLP